jgi:predicted ATP-binding protein involved in virulence
MRITKIFVEKLFGVFDHEIRLNLDDRITIIHSPNGYGKTIILKMLDGLFNDRYSELESVPYESFNIEFDSGQKIEIRKEEKVVGKDSKTYLGLKLHSKNGEEIRAFTTRFTRKNIESTVSILTNHYSSLKKIEDGTWLYGTTTFNTEDLIEHLKIPVKVAELIRQDREWLTAIKKDVNIYLIESQRLLSLTNGKDRTKNRDSPTLLSTVISYPGKLAEVIKGALAEYASASQSLDRSFPARLVKRTSFDELSNDEFRNKLAELEESRSHLMDLGLLEKSEEKNLPIQSQDIDEGSRRMLSVYIEDTEKKLALFDNISKRLDLFRKIINSKFSYKEISIDRHKGFIFKSKYPEESKNKASGFLSPSSLSSGEQNELVLIYELLFKAKEKSLVLIDEPELSLHLGWQVKFLEDLQEISALADLDFLIATHAPSLIHDRWDLTVELKGVAP